MNYHDYVLDDVILCTACGTVAVDINHLSGIANENRKS